MLSGLALLAVASLLLWSWIMYDMWSISWNTAGNDGAAVGCVTHLTHIVGDVLWQWMGWYGLCISLGCALLGVSYLLGWVCARWRLWLFLPVMVCALSVTYVLGFVRGSGVIGLLGGRSMVGWLHDFSVIWWVRFLLWVFVGMLLVLEFRLWPIFVILGRSIRWIYQFLRSKRPEKPVITRQAKAQDYPDKKSRKWVKKAQPFAGKKRVQTVTSEGLPPTNILSDVEQFSASSTSPPLKEMEAQLLRVMEDFGVQGSIARVSAGPVVSLFEFVPAPGVKTTRVVSLSDDIARAMSAHSVRIATLPGQNALGVEISNKTRDMVTFKPLLEDVLGTKHDMSLPIILGRNIAGNPVVVDLASMPHLLVAGTTGSGKSVGLNVIIMSLLFRYTSEQLRLLMIDPKVLELSIYEGIPHLLTGVVTNPKNASQALKWLVQEMEDRYQTMAQIGVRNVASFNEMVERCKKKGETLSRKVQTGFDNKTGVPLYEEQDMQAETMPYIVAIVDEMADLMLSVGKNVEVSIQRLAQKARAAGIHVIMATQRPSVDVVTGTIKANFPSRLVFQVSSKIDSRTVIGEQGAEQLLGKGDMLYLSAGGRLQRVHGPFLSDADIAATVRWLQKHVGPPDIQPVFSAPNDQAHEDDEGESPELYQEAKEIVLKSKKASTSFLQRKLQIGYNRAAMLIEALEENGVISEADHVGRRRVLRHERAGTE